MTMKNSNLANIEESLVALANNVGFVGKSLQGAMLSNNSMNSVGTEANVVDALAYLASSARRIADAVTPNITGGRDETGGHVESLTEAVMGATAGLCRIADAIGDLAEAVREHGRTAP